MTKRQQRTIERRAAYNAFDKALAIGEIQRAPACENCGKEPPPALHGHHYLGYEKEHWLDLRWLCQSCHGREHGGLEWDHASKYHETVTDDAFRTAVDGKWLTWPLWIQDAYAILVEGATLKVQAAKRNVSRQTIYMAIWQWNKKFNRKPIGKTEDGT